MLPVRAVPAPASAMVVAALAACADPGARGEDGEFPFDCEKDDEASR